MARERQEAARRRQRRNRVFLQGGIGLGIVAVAAIVVLVIAHGMSGTTSEASSVAGPKNMATNGIAFDAQGGKVAPVLTAAVPAKATPRPVGAKNSDGPTKVVTYIDWACPVCKQFEADYSSQILSLVAQGKATLEIHPVSILDTHYGTTQYATRAADAAACVANYDPDDFLAVQNEFYDNQPVEGSSGLTNAQIKALVKKGGATSPKITQCIDSEAFKPWVTASTNRVLVDPSLVSSSTHSFGTPTVVVNGKIWDGSSNLISEIAGG